MQTGRIGKGLDRVGGADGLQFVTVLHKPRLPCRRILVGAEKRVGEDAEVPEARTRKRGLFRLV